MATNGGIERYGSAGVHTVEGNLAGARAARLAKERDRQQAEFAQKKHDIQQSNQRGARIDANFESHRDDDESEFKVPVCVWTLSAVMRHCGASRAHLRVQIALRRTAPDRWARDGRGVPPEAGEPAEPHKCSAGRDQVRRFYLWVVLLGRVVDHCWAVVGVWLVGWRRAEAAKPKKKRKVKKLGPLSFDPDEGFGGDASDDDEGAKTKTKKKKIVKNPNVATDFLPDKEREQEEARERQRLRAEWEAEQERIKSACGCCCW